MSDTEKTTLHFSATVISDTLLEDDEQLKPEPYLIVLAGPNQGALYRLKDARNYFGRSRTADVVLDDRKISRRHGAIVVNGGSVELIDLESTNGCLVNGSKVERACIGPNVRIQAGDTVMKVEFKLATEIEAAQNLKRAANSDPLTGIMNRRAFMKLAEQEFAQTQRHRNEMALIMCDADYFKRINDCHGHLAGDQVLQDLAAILQNHRRKGDLLARYGGEEFIVLLPRTDGTDARDWAERIRILVENFEFNYKGIDIPVTLSIGVKSYHQGHTENLDMLIDQADQALYQAKQSGRNKVVYLDVD